MTVDEVLVFMESLQDDDLRRIDDKIGDLQMRSIRKWLKEPLPQPQTDNARREFLQWIESLPEDPSLPEDLAHNHDHYLYGTPKRP